MHLKLHLYVLETIATNIMVWGKMVLLSLDGKLTINAAFRTHSCLSSGLSILMNGSSQTGIHKKMSHQYCARSEEFFGKSSDLLRCTQSCLLLPCSLNNSKSKRAKSFLKRNEYCNKTLQRSTKPQNNFTTIGIKRTTE